MIDAASFSATFTSIKAILDLLKSANDGQLAMKIGSETSNLLGKLIDVQEQVSTTQAEDDHLRAEDQRLNAMIFHHGVNWRTRPDGTEDGPFCHICVGPRHGYALAVATNR